MNTTETLGRRSWKRGCLLLAAVVLLPPVAILVGLESIARRRAREFEQEQLERRRRFDAALPNRTLLRGVSRPGNAWDVYEPVCIRIDASPFSEVADLQSLLHGGLACPPVWPRRRGW